MQLKKIIAFALVLNTKYIKNTINLSAPSSYFILSGADAKLELASPMTNVQGTIQITNKNEDSITQTNTDNNIEFNGGSIVTDNSSYTMIGKLNVASGDTIELRGNEKLEAAGTISEKIMVSGANNTISGSPKFANPIVLSDASTELTLSIVEPLSNNITLNGGKLILGNDLTIGDELKIFGNGTLDINGKTLQLPVLASEDVFDGNIDFLNANDINVRTRTSRSSTWRFYSNDNIRGWGVILDMDDEDAEIRLSNSNRTLDINNLHIKGIGDDKGHFTIDNSSSKIRLTNCTIELDGDYTFDNGTLLIDGDNCKIISRNSDKFIIDGSNTKLQIDGVVLRYDSLGQANTNPFVTQNGGTIEKLNGGEIRSTYIPGSTGSNSVGDTDASSESDINLGDNSTLNFTNENTSQPKAINFNGRGQALNFAESTNQPFVVEENVTLNLQDTVINNFDPSKFALAGSGGTKGKVKFGNNTTLRQNKNLNLSGDPIEVEGNATFEGNGNILNIPTKKLTVDGNSTLTLKNVVVNAETHDSIQVLNSNSSVRLEKMELNLTSTGLTLDKGTLVIENEVKINAINENTSNEECVLNFTSPNNITVNDNSTLRFGRDTKFNYNPDTSSDGGDRSVEKRHITTNSNSSKIVLEHATFNCGSTGIAFDQGRFFIEGSSKFEIPGDALEINSNVNMTVMPGAILSFDGPVLYT